MPTGARLVSGLYFGVLAFILSQLVHAALEADVGYKIDVGSMKIWFVVVGALTGWSVMGKRAHGGRNYAIQGGILTSFSIVFWLLIMFSLVEMLGQSTKLKYSDAPEAVMDAFRIAIEYVADLWTVPMVLLLVVGGAFGGIAAEFISHRWR